jgi:hypothetical protein
MWGKMRASEFYADCYSNPRDVWSHFEGVFLAFRLAIGKVTF